MTRRQSRNKRRSRWMHHVWKAMYAERAQERVRRAFALSIEKRMNHDMFYWLFKPNPIFAILERMKGIGYDGQGIAVETTADGR